MNTLAEIVAGFEPDTDKALVFLEIPDTGHDLPLLLAELEDFVKRKIDYEIFKGGQSDIVLMRLMPLEAREAILMLSESGIVNLMVLYPHNKR